MLITKALNINTDINIYLCLEVADDILLLYHIIERKFNLFVDETLKNISISLFYSKFVIRLYIVIKSLIQDIKKNKSIKYKFILSIISNIFLFIIIILGLIYSYLINKLNPSIEYSIWFNYGFNIWILFIIPARIL